MVTHELGARSSQAGGLSPQFSPGPQSACARSAPVLVGMKCRYPHTGIKTFHCKELVLVCSGASDWVFLHPSPLLPKTVVPLLLGWAPFVLLESREGERPPQFSRSPFARVPVLKHGIDDRRDTLHHYGLRPYMLHVSTPLLWLDHSGHRLPRRRRASWISPCLTWSSAAKSSRTKNQR